MSEKLVRVKVQGGKASQAPPLGPTLNQLGINAVEVINKINELTKGFEGMEINVDIYVNSVTKDYRIEVKSPTTTSLLLKFAGVQQPSGDPAHKKVGDISFDKVVEVSILKKSDLTAKSLKSAVRSVISTAGSIGLTIDGKDFKQVLKEVDEGLYDEVLKKYEGKWMA
ncbi:MAG: 50S ribosomal protein L11 [Sulfolobales archaeon]|nr:50S ribosomal protein L11 [Sulfolobales archaeon]MCX8186328.1 50S ribosomal protein L11 [Sulfolobales archaeon]MDW7968936.1 50S ribosomal protein L11 [Sulfolobales archaeon]